MAQTLPPNSRRGGDAAPATTAYTPPAGKYTPAANYHYQHNTNTSPKTYLWSAFKEIKEKNLDEFVCIYKKYEEPSIVDYYDGNITESYASKNIIDIVGKGFFEDIYNKLGKTNYKAYVYKNPFFVHDIRVNSNWIILDDLENILGENQMPFLIKGKLENIGEEEVKKLLEEHKDLTVKFYSSTVNVGNLSPMIFFNSIETKPNLATPAPTQPARPIKSDGETISVKRIKRSLGNSVITTLTNKEKFIHTKVNNTINLVFPEKKPESEDKVVDESINLLKKLNINNAKDKKEIIRIQTLLIDLYLSNPQIKFEIASLADTNHVTQHSLRKVYRKAICLRIDERTKV